MHRFLTTLLSLACTAACAVPVSRSSTGSPTAVNDRIISTRYDADRFFATAPLRRGDTATFFLDTGSGTYVWDSYIPYLELTIRDSVPNARGVKTAVTPFPVLREPDALPPAVSSSAQGTGLLVYPVDWRARNNFVAWIGRSSQAELGSNWFNGRVWTFDYPHRRLVLRGRSSASDGEPGREVPFHFPLDSVGNRVGHLGYVDVVIDGDSVAMLMDTGATVWLSSAALEVIGDGGPSERSTSHISTWLFNRLRERHPDWPVIQRADLWLGLSLMRVPSVIVAGHEVGPTWLSVIGGTATPPTIPANAPAWMKRNGGMLGGSLLKQFVVTLDYPRGVVRLHKQ
jgi:hypothetical protein